MIHPLHPSNGHRFSRTYTGLWNAFRSSEAAPATLPLSVQTMNIPIPRILISAHHVNHSAQLKNYKALEKNYI